LPPSRIIAGVSALTTRDQWLAELSTGGSSPKTISNYRSATDEALATIASRHGVAPGELPLASIDRDDVVAAVAAHQSRPDARTGLTVMRAQSTSVSFFTAVRSFLSWCTTTGRLETNPARSVKTPKAPARVPKAMSTDECRALLTAAASSRTPERDALAVVIGLTMGLRLGELSRLRLDDLAPDAVNATHMRVLGKGSKERVVPVPDVVRRALAAYLPVRAARLSARAACSDALFVSQRLHSGDPAMTRDGMGQVFDRLLRAAGLKVPGRRVHAARHSFATHVLAGGADIVSVSELLGHASVATTQIYLKVDPARLAAAVEASDLAGLGEDLGAGVECATSGQVAPVGEA
jgi:site-specific recombinase XerD